MLNRSDIVTAEKVFRTEYNRAVAEYEATSAWDQMATIGTEIPSTGAEEDYRWLQEMPEFEEWLGDLNSKDLEDYSYTIRNKEFAASVAIHVNELEDDKYDIIMPRIASMAGKERGYWGKLLHTILLAGTTNLAYDGIAFFSNASGVRINDNLLAGTISAATPTVAQAAADVNTARKSMMAFTNSRGEILGIVPDTFVIPPNLELVFLSLMNSTADPTTSNSGTKNPYSSMIQRLIVDPGLTDANDFYCLATRYSVGPFVKQKRKDVETFLDDSQKYVNRKLKFGATFRGNVGYGLPILAAKVVSAVG